ncbi:MAG: hypothetical protein ACYTBZ_27660 [Planctomycetota bacterium]
MIWKCSALAVLAISLCAVSGCAYVESMQTLPGGADTTLDANEPAPWQGVLVPRGRYDFLIRCEGYVEREGIIP